MGLLEKLGLRKGRATDGAETQAEPVQAPAQKNQPGEVSKGQIWRDSAGCDYEVVSVLEGISYRLQFVSGNPKPGWPLGSHMSVTDASELLDDPSWSLVSGPSQPFNLFEACKIGDVGVARELIESDSGLTHAMEAGGIRPLHVAATEGHAQVVSLLLDSGADVDAQNHYGVTPLYLAAAWGHREVVSVLLAAGADTTIKEQDGETALGAATRKGHTAVAELLEGTDTR